MRRSAVLCFLSVTLVAGASLTGQTALIAAAIALRSQQATIALDRYLETWSLATAGSRATSLHFPHVRPGAGAFEMTRTPEEDAAGVNFQQTLRTGWHHSEWVSMEVLQVGLNKVHVAGKWQRYSEDGRPLGSSVITYIITSQNNHWGVQARFATGAGETDAATAAKNSAAGLTALAVVHAGVEFTRSEGAGRGAALSARARRRRQCRSVENRRRIPGGSRAGTPAHVYQTRLDQSKVVQVSANGVSMTVSISRLGRDGHVLSKDEGVFLAIPRDGAWKIQARSMFGV